MKGRRVLVAPLDWGLGHATRCIPIIYTLLENNNEVFLGGSGFSLAILKNEFPQLRAFDLPSYNPVYSPTASMVLTMAAQLPKFITAIYKEHVIVNRLVKQHKIDCVIADNRYGCWCPHATSIFITHQLSILLPNPWLQKAVNFFNTRQIRKFDHCWIPDTDGDNNLSGQLSINHNIDARKNIGALSRFSFTANVAIRYDVLILLSGPEPQRSILEEILTGQFKKLPYTILMVRGVQGSSKVMISHTFEKVDHLTGKELEMVLSQSHSVVARSGYSTIMDLAKLRKTAIFIPTPGQTEQAYLASRLKKLGIAYYETQNEFNAERALIEVKKITGFKEDYSNINALQIAIEEIG